MLLVLRKLELRRDVKKSFFAVVICRCSVSHYLLLCTP